MCLIDDEDEEVVALPVHVASKLGLTSMEKGGGGGDDGKGLGNLGNLEMMMWMMMTMMMQIAMIMLLPMASSIFNRLLGESPALLKTHLHHQPSSKSNIIVLKMEIGKPVIGEV